MPPGPNPDNYTRAELEKMLVDFQEKSKALNVTINDLVMEIKGGVEMTISLKAEQKWVEE